MTTPAHPSLDVGELPRQLAAAVEPGQALRARIPLARLGEFEHKDQGPFSITPETVGWWSTNLAGPEHGQVPIDYDHSVQKRGITEAAGWIKGVSIDGDLVMGDVEFTPQGAQAIRDGRYRYISCTFTDNLRDENGVQHGPALVGAGLTNTPYFKSLPPLALDDVPASRPVQRVHADSARRHAAAERILLAKGINPGAATLDEYMAAVEQVPEPNEPVTLDDDPVTVDAPTVVLDGGVVPKPEGDVNAHGYVRLGDDVDRDMLLSDPVAAARAWRRVRANDERVQREGAGVLSGYAVDGDPSVPPAKFVEDFRTFADQGLDRAATVELNSWDAEQRLLARRRARADDMARQERASKAAIDAEMALMASDQREYAAHMIQLRRSVESAGNVFAVAESFEQFRQRRRQERAEAALAAKRRGQ